MCVSWVGGGGGGGMGVVIRKRTFSDSEEPVITLAVNHTEAFEQENDQQTCLFKKTYEYSPHRLGQKREKTKGHSNRVTSVVQVNGHQNKNVNDQGGNDNEKTHRRNTYKSGQLNYAC